MPRAAILTYDGCYSSSVGGFADILQIANSHLKLERAPTSDLFDWCFVSQSGEPVIASNGLPLHNRKFGPRERFDLVFVPSFHYGGHRQFDDFLERQADACAWLISQWRSGAYLAANCTGTFLVAKTGLLDGHTATTTWWLERQFRTKFPNVDLQLRPVLTEADRIICAGASASYLIQTIRVIERFSGPVIASQVAKAMLIDVSQTSQIPFLPLLAQRHHTDALVHRAQSWMQNNMAKVLRISELAEELAVSDRTLIRRFRCVLGQTPLAYLQDLRLESARAILETSSLSVEKVSFQVGYNDTSSFSRLFRKRVGMSPGSYRKRFQLDAAI